ncbi:23S rRNA (uridine-2'-O-) methyltransferase [Natronomonas pharaonis DSM 2160]|uniref:Ribosomal RNA large subunit methyltransferase E n=1 Tax=Natronomonas pharaonis (strain ATCC 35678 / DSM 2160 / CIP 103997 / JCM 8858 / NBRC 14720 / NCIMB 2260 / Gabara) TaxID=348780 RepID=RLME_NATPD|nr:23S rRNA (uridine(2552)-2'-O)-methyltransferase [Natronomonas pharaonis]Q3IT24.1 RecName: Full=Ribosomal RNA large subunit methyltransferase E; AltName: Full=23S rRNA Um2552 methyltransferase; AltName: Full=rRNA (uridine-2'-O-)-methyltransferase [Natronomonas pharaonis DSM 2160]CAI48710.1 23S rRNA (uridine-2'-O-) methyltransferase [Natronomonas pharaonis DSM 2160]
MTRKDDYYNRAKQQGYRSRAAYKLKQLDEAADLINEGDTVVDLGAAPGGWLQVANELAGEAGTVVGVDLQRIDPIEGVETVRGDMTEDATREKVRALVGEADVVISDMAPNMTGEYSLDHARSVHLARMAFETALDLLAPNGDLVAKVFEGPDTDDLRADIDREFEYVRTIHPDASRDSSSELFMVAKGRLTAPVREGDTLEVEIDNLGDEGDGVAKVDGYTLFVSGAEPGDAPEVRVTDVKPRFGFAETLE